MQVVEVTDWPVIHAEPRGGDERKAWIAREPGVDRDEWWLWKPCLATGGSSSGQRRLNDVAEAVTYRLAQAIDLPSAQCELATRDGVPGVISRNVSPPTMELVHGSSVVFPFLAYGLTSITMALAGVGGPPPHERRSALQVFTGYLVLDAWIANTDRHGENWGILQAPDGSSTLAPAFDHGSALGSGLTDVNRASRDVDAFCRAGRTRHFEGGGTLLDLAGEAVMLSGATDWPERVAAVPPQHWRGILGDIEGMSEGARTFIDGILTRNQERVSTLCR